MKFKNKLFRLSLFLVFLTVASLAKAETTDSTQNRSTHGKLIFAADLIRHGDRTPLITLPTVNYTWTEGLEQLTPQGSDQEFAVGKQLKDRYITQSHLLPDHYLPGTIYARSTGSDRTIMSANAVLEGLYSDASSNFNSLFLPPVHNCPRAAEDELLPDNNLTFNFNQLFQSTIVTLPEWQAKEASLKGNFERWSQATGIPITQLYDLKNLGDTLYIYQLNHIPTPPLLTEEDVQTIIDAGLWATCITFQNKIVGQTAAANLLQEIANSCQSATNPNELLRCRLYCAHDSTLSVLLTALGKADFSTTIPPYASDLNIELFDEGNGNYTVQVMLNDQPVILSCTGKNSCTLAQLKALSDEASAQLKKVQVSQKL